MTNRRSGSSSNFSIIVLQKTAQPVLHPDFADSFLRRFVNRPVPKGLVRPLSMIIRTELADQQFKVSLRTNHKVIQAFFFDGPIKPFTEGIQIWTLGRQLDRFHLGGHKRLLEFLPKEGIPIMDKPAAFGQKSVFAISQVSCHLDHPFLCRVTHNPTNMDLPCREFHDH